MADLPEGTVTFLFTDLEGSTRLLQAHPDAYRAAVARHHALLAAAVAAHGGAVFETVGDAVYAAFARPTDAVAAALAGQVALGREPWGDTPLRARMGVHLGEAERQGGHYFGAPLYRCARLMGTAHGGQVVLSEAAVALVRDALPEGAGLRDLGAHRLKDLQRPERVFQLAAPGLLGAFPALRSLDALPHNLPLQLTSFVGRERELAEVAALLAAHRLVTLTGAGGTGKTRLALQAAADALEAYPDGVWLAELAALADPALVPQAVAAAIGVREEPGRPLLATLTDALRPKRLLLVLDNCEHLVEACARLADGLLRACPTLTVLATSREALGLAGETVWRVPSLAAPTVPAGQPPPVDTLTRYEAVRLFEERAQAVQPRFAVTTESAQAVVAVCALLDGLPLALELAAARVRALSVDQLLGRLEDRFRLLTGGSRTALERHQTLRAAVDWSHALLTDPERALFARLAVFAGGFTLEAAEAVGTGDGLAAEDVLDLLTRLVDKSLVVAEAPPAGTARYRLLETLRQYAQERLAAGGVADAVRDRHAAFYLALAEREGGGDVLSASAPWLDAAERDHDNLRAALHWFGRRGTHDQALALAAGVARLWYLRGYMAAGLARLREVLAAAGAAARTPAGVRVLGAAARFARYAGDLAQARAYAEAGLALAEELDDPGQRGQSLSYLGVLAHQAGDLAGARALQEQALALLRQGREELKTAAALDRLAQVVSGLGEAAAARRLQEEALALRRALGSAVGMGWSFAHLGDLAVDGGDLAARRRAYAECFAVSAGLLPPPVLARALEGCAAVAVAARRGERGLRLLGAAAVLRETSGAVTDGRERAQRTAELARQQAGQRVADAAWSQGQAMSLEQAVADALEDAPDAA